MIHDSNDNCDFRDAVTYEDFIVKDFYWWGCNCEGNLCNSAPLTNQTPIFLMAFAFLTHWLIKAFQGFAWNSLKPVAYA
ncbi:hypothetical protein EB796_003214 [Bugula neritina]|uniref:Uncharacterized protein n=1 Tax=Bugula neritina TaxID=10212 RepID=A0A7J7KL80_BUGNE|nr:hypothetical protein EB796_003214 [Bugula neritina]